MYFLGGYIMSNFRKLLLAALTFSVLGSLATQDLVAMNSPMQLFSINKAYGKHNLKDCVNYISKTLTRAIAQRDVVGIKFMLENVDTKVLSIVLRHRKKDGCNHLTQAIEVGCENIIRMLLNDPHVKAESVNDALKTAILYGKKDIFESLITNPQITTKGIASVVVWRLFTSDGNDEMIQWLVTHDCVTCEVVNQAVPKLVKFYTWFTNEAKKVAQALIFDGRVTTQNIDKAFLYAVAEGNIKLVRIFLLDNRISDQAINIALVRATSDRNPQMINILRTEPRVSDVSPFLLEDLMNVEADPFRLIAGYVGNPNNQDRVAMKCVNHKSQNLL